MHLTGKHSNASAAEKQIWQILETVADPEVPVLSVVDLGIIRELAVLPGTLPGSEIVSITITPTYSGCPAMDAIAMDIRLRLLENGYEKITLLTQLSPAWTTDWLSESGKEKLKAYGIAPPNHTAVVCDTGLFADLEGIQCPQCNSYHTALVSRFGSTPCKSLYQCLDCKEPFDYFKCH